MQGHRVIVIGSGEGWGRELPGIVEERGKERELAKADGVGEGGGKEKERMKIAWRYERLGEFGSGNGGVQSPRGGLFPLHCHVDASFRRCSREFFLFGGADEGKLGLPLQQRNPLLPGQVTSDAQEQPTAASKVFCHTFDLTKRLGITDPTAITYIPFRPVGAQTSPFTSVIPALTQCISSSPSNAIFRIVIPTLLSPAFYPTHASHPHNLLPFLHSLRALLHQHPARLTLMLSLPVTLYPRSTGLTRWIELLSDGVIELIPFPHTIDTGPSLTTSGAATSTEDKPQGMVKVHRLPVFHERGGGAGGGVLGDDLAFTVSRRKFLIKPFALPPVEGDLAAQRGEAESGKPTKVDMEF